MARRKNIIALLVAAVYGGIMAGIFAKMNEPWPMILFVGVGPVVCVVIIMLINPLPKWLAKTT